MSGPSARTELPSLTPPPRAQELRAHRFARMPGGSGSNPMMQTYAVTVPPGVGPGQQFQASLDGQLTMVIANSRRHRHGTDCAAIPHPSTKLPPRKTARVATP